MENSICPKCKREDIQKGKLAAAAMPVQMFLEHNRGTSSPISAEYCNDCGYILSLYVNDPKNVR